MPKLTGDMMRSFQVLAGSDGRLLDALASSAQIQRFAPRNVIVMSEDGDKDVFFLLKGRAKANVISIGGHAMWVDDLAPGDLFGEMAALGGTPRTAEISAVSAVTLAAYSADVFIGLMERHGSLGIAVSRILIERLRKTTRRMFELSVLSAPGRIYAEFLRLADFGAGDPQGYGIIRPIPILSELATRANATRETASRAFHDLVRKGVIIRRTAHLLVRSPAPEDGSSDPATPAWSAEG